MPRVQIKIPSFSLVLLIGPAGSGKSTFARKHFGPAEWVSSDHCRAMISNDEANLRVTADAFEVLHLIVRKRLMFRRLTVVDATNVQLRARKPLLAIAREFGCPVVGIVFDFPAELCYRFCRRRPERPISREVIRKQRRQLKESMKSSAGEGFDAVYVLASDSGARRVSVTRGNR